MPLVSLAAHVDGRGEAWLRLPFVEEGVFYLRVGPALEVMNHRLTSQFSLLTFHFVVDFSVVSEKQRELGLIEPGVELSIFDFLHPVWMHSPGTFCSNCMVPEPEFEPEEEDDPDALDHPSPDDPYAQDRSEDLAEAVLGMSIEHHADCAACGKDFITEHWQTYLHTIGDAVYCEECRRIAEQWFGPPP